MIYSEEIQPQKKSWNEGTTSKNPKENAQEKTKKEIPNIDFFEITSDVTGYVAYNECGEEQFRYIAIQIKESMKLLQQVQPQTAQQLKNKEEIEFLPQQNNHKGTSEIIDERSRAVWLNDLLICALILLSAKTKDIMVLQSGIYAINFLIKNKYNFDNIDNILDKKIKLVYDEYNNAFRNPELYWEELSPVLEGEQEINFAAALIKKDFIIAKDNEGFYAFKDSSNEKGDLLHEVVKTEHLKILMEEEGELPHAKKEIDINYEDIKKYFTKKKKEQKALTRKLSEDMQQQLLQQAVKKQEELEKQVEELTLNLKQKEKDAKQLQEQKQQLTSLVETLQENKKLIQEKQQLKQNEDEDESHRKMIDIPLTPEMTHSSESLQNDYRIGNLKIELEEFEDRKTSYFFSVINYASVIGIACAASYFFIEANLFNMLIVAAVAALMTYAAKRALRDYSTNAYHTTKKFSSLKRFANEVFRQFSAKSKAREFSLILLGITFLLATIVLASPFLLSLLPGVSVSTAWVEPVINTGGMLQGLISMLGEMSYIVVAAIAAATVALPALLINGFMKLFTKQQFVDPNSGDLQSSPVSKSRKDQNMDDIFYPNTIRYIWNDPVDKVMSMIGLGNKTSLKL